MATRRSFLSLLGIAPIAGLIVKNAPAVEPEKILHKLSDEQMKAMKPTDPVTEVSTRDVSDTRATMCCTYSVTYFKPGEL